MTTHPDFTDFITVDKSTYDPATHTTEVCWHLKSYDGVMLLMDYTPDLHEGEDTEYDRSEDIDTFIREKEEELREA